MMKRPALVIFILMSMMRVSAMAGYHVEDGGGGIISESGDAVTFRDSQIPFFPRNETAADINGFSIVLNWLRQSSLSVNTKERIFYHFNPSAIRIYHRSPMEKVTLDSKSYYAISDQKQQVTILLFGFFSLLSPNEQAEVLFHETLYCLGVAEADSLAENFRVLLETPQDSATAKKFYDQMSKSFE